MGGPVGERMPKHRKYPVFYQLVRALALFGTASDIVPTVSGSFHLNQLNRSLYDQLSQYFPPDQNASLVDRN
jgi:hypothetical protein